MTQKHVRVIGPSSHIEPEQVSGGIKWLEDNGLKVTVADQVYFKNYQSAGTIDDKINALHEAFSNKDIDIIMASCGGNGAIHLLDHIDFDLIKNNPKPFIGFSDTTILLNSINARSVNITYHGPTLSRLSKPLPDSQKEQFLNILNGNNPSITWDDCEAIKQGNTTGRLIGGNLSAFQTLLGTPSIIQSDEPFILFFEDIADEISRYDRILGHIKHTGLLNKTSAILFGLLEGNDTPTRLPFGKTIEDVIRDNTKGLDIPIAMNCPFGHRGNLWTLPVGKMVNLEINENIQIDFN